MKADVIPLKELTLNGVKVPANRKIRVDANIAEAWIKAGLAKLFKEPKPAPTPAAKK